MVREACWHCKGTIKQRKVDPKVVQDVGRELSHLEESILTILEEEKEEEDYQKR